MPANRKARITRRGFLQVGSSAAIAAGVPSSSANSETALPSASLSGKIALEEHFDFPATASVSYAAPGSAEFKRQIQDLGSGRIAEMDLGGVEVCILSLVGPGIQAITNSRQAAEVARQANDHLAENIAKNPKRLKGFAALALQDPQGAAQELTRCIKELGFCGALVNGFTQFAEADTIGFYDMPQYRDFWATVQALDVPFYLHPRSPLPAHQPALSRASVVDQFSMGLHRRNIDSCAALDGWRVVRRVS